MLEFNWGNLSVEVKTLNLPIKLRRYDELLMENKMIKLKDWKN